MDVNANSPSQIDYVAKSKNMDNHQGQFVAAAGVKALVLVLENDFDGDVKMLEHACMALRHRTLYPSNANRVECRQAGGVKALVNILERHINGPIGVLEQACGALQNIMDAKARIQCGQVGGVEALVCIVQRNLTMLD